jgi:hypothetical protein
LTLPLVLALLPGCIGEPKEVAPAGETDADTDTDADADADTDDTGDTATPGPGGINDGSYDASFTGTLGEVEWVMGTSFDPISWYEVTCNVDNTGLYRFEARTIDETIGLQLGLQNPEADTEYAYPELGEHYLRLGTVDGTWLDASVDPVSSATIVVEGFTADRGFNGTLDVEWVVSAEDPTVVGSATGIFTMYCGLHD